MSEYNASDTRAIRAAAKRAKALDAERSLVVLNLMSSPGGRSYMYDRLVRTHIFSSSFSDSGRREAFNEGERNVGLQDLNDVMRFAPDQYIQMMREANDREQADGRRSDSPAAGSGPGNRRDNTGPEPEAGSVVSDYDPGDEDRTGAED